MKNKIVGLLCGFFVVGFTSYMALDTFVITDVYQTNATTDTASAFAAAKQNLADTESDSRKKLRRRVQTAGCRSRGSQKQKKRIHRIALIRAGVRARIIREEEQHEVRSRRRLRGILRVLPAKMPGGKDMAQETVKKKAV